VKNVIKYSYCRYKTSENGFKLIWEPWGFKFYTVKMLEYFKCHNIFNHYYSMNPKIDRISEFMIRIRLNEEESGCD